MHLYNGHFLLASDTFMNRQTNVSHTFGKLLNATLTALFVSGKVSAALYNHNRRIQTFSLCAFPLAYILHGFPPLLTEVLIFTPVSTAAILPCSSAIPNVSHAAYSTRSALVTRVDQHCITLTMKRKTHICDMTAAELFCLRSIRNKAKTLKGTVHPKVKTLRPSKM